MVFMNCMPWLQPEPHFESFGCANDDQECKDREMPFYASYPVFPGRVFDDNDVGTFVAPASGNVLLRVELSCDVRNQQLSLQIAKEMFEPFAAQVKALRPSLRAVTSPYYRPANASDPDNHQMTPAQWAARHVPRTILGSC